MFKSGVLAALVGLAQGAVFTDKVRSLFGKKPIHEDEEVGHVMDRSFHDHLTNTTDPHTQVLVGHLKSAFGTNRTRSGRYLLSQKFRLAMDTAIDAYAPGWYTSSNHGSATSSQSQCSSGGSGTSSESAGLGLCVYQNTWSNGISKNNDGVAKPSRRRLISASGDSAAWINYENVASKCGPCPNPCTAATAKPANAEPCALGANGVPPTIATGCTGTVLACQERARYAQVYSTWRNMFGLKCGDCKYMSVTGQFIANEKTLNGQWIPLANSKGATAPAQRGTRKGKTVPIQKCGQSACNGGKQASFGLPAINQGAGAINFASGPATEVVFRCCN